MTNNKSNLVAMALIERPAKDHEAWQVKDFLAKKFGILQQDIDLKHKTLTVKGVDNKEISEWTRTFNGFLKKSFPKFWQKSLQNFMNGE